jgi:hypothetical protein
VLLIRPHGRVAGVRGSDSFRVPTSVRLVQLLHA